MSIFVPNVTKQWGDWITALWASELHHELCPEDEIIFDPTCWERPGEKKNVLDYVYLPWVSDYDNSMKSVSLATLKYQKVLSTHHRHCHKRSMYANSNGNKLVYYDAHGLNYRFLRDNWYPTFHPSSKLQDEFKKLNLPNGYVVLHLNNTTPDKDFRTGKPLQQWLDENKKFIDTLKTNQDVVSTGYHIPGTIDLSKLHGWLKIYVMIKSERLWGSLTGFTSIASVYRQCQWSNLVNEAGPGIFNMGPPPISYSNYSISNFGSYKAIYKYAEMNEKFHGENYRLFCENEWKNWYSYSNLGLDEFTLNTEDFSRQEYYNHIDNCLVPLDVTYCNDNDYEKKWDFRYDKEMFEISNIALNPKNYERYHK